MRSHGSAAELQRRRQLALDRVKDGYTQLEVASFLKVHERTVRRWVAQYREKGEAGIAAKPHPGRTPKLAASQVRQVLNWLRKNPKSFGFPTELWTGGRLVELIERKFKVKFHPGYITEWIVQYGFSFQKPQRQVKERDEAAIKHFIEHDWPRLQNERRRQRAHLVLIDEACSQLRPLLRRTMAPRGQPPIFLHSKYYNDKVSMMGALTLSPRRGRLGFYCSTLPQESFDDWGTAWFLKQLLAHQRGKIIVVWDQGRIHRGSAVRALLAKHPRLEVVELPAYAPELNPVEFVWSYLKYGRICNLGAKDVQALSGILETELDQVQDNQSLLKKLWHRSGLPWPDRLLAS